MANEVLYALDAAKKTSVGHLSRLTLQKVLYLSGSLAPLKDIFLEYLKFNSEMLGPYKGEIQETVDHLVGIGLVDIIYFERTRRRGIRKAGARSHYVISDTGEEVVNRLILYPHEEEKDWWISLVTGLSYSYLEAGGLSGTVDEKIKSIIYQDLTYNTFREKNLFRRLIDLTDKRGLTYQFVEFLKNYAHESNVIPSDISERKKVEIMLLTFMEYLYTGSLNEASNDSSTA
jgi:hypothetical protein